MKTFSTLLMIALATTSTLVSAIPTAHSPAQNKRWNTPKKPAAFYLAGDSTTAAYSAGGGGWGVGFLSTLTNHAIGTDLGYNGATTASFVSGGAWANTIDAVKRATKEYTPYVTIQFGHNDQKTTSGINITQYSTNLQNLAKEAIAAGGIPILVTSISRRNYNVSGVVIQDLEPQRLATIAVAASLNISCIDLNIASTNYLNAIGAANAATYNRISTDFTHLNPKGSVLFGSMVSWLMTSTTPYGAEIARFTKPNATIMEDIKAGVYVLPSL